jgi:acetyltransferase-like isoleucine patch superfamily enzyme
LINGGVNPSRSGVGSTEARFNRWLLRARGVTVGTNIRIALNCRLFSPRSIHIGDETEMLRNSTIDGSPSAHNSLVLGRHCRVKENVWLAAYGGYVRIGDRVLIGRNSVIHGHGGVTIGDDSMIGPCCSIFSSDHTFLLNKIFQTLGEKYLKTTVGKNVWLGAGVIVIAGSAIEDNVAVAAGSVVRGRLEGGKLYAGTPAKMMKDLPHG